MEEQARTVGAAEVAEALDKQHPYSKEQNPDFDAFGFYEAHGFHQDHSSHLAWQSPDGGRVECVVVRKNLLALRLMPRLIQKFIFIISA